MTPPAAATAAGRTARAEPAPRTRRPVAAPPPRRVSGPTRKARRPAVSRPRTTQPLAARLAARAVALAEARFLDRLIRGRLWIGIVAFGLLGIVFMQVSMLKLNTGISRAVATAQTLERQNSALQEAVSRLDGGARIQALAAQQGMLQPTAGQVHYLRAHGVSDARLAAQRIRPPAPGSTTGTASSTSTTGAVTTTAGQTGVATGTPAAPAAATAPGTTAPAAPSAAPGATSGAAPGSTSSTTSGTTPGAVAAPGAQQGTAAGGAGTGQG